MGEVVETIITDFSGGISNDVRSTNERMSQIVTNMDIFTDFKRAIPYFDSESGDSGSATSQKQNFCLAHWLPGSANDWRLFSLGVKSGGGRAEILMKTLTVLGTAGANDLSDNGWSTPGNNQSGAGSTSFNLFIYYPKTGFIYGAQGDVQIWAFDPTAGAAWVDTVQTLTYTNICQGIIFSKDDILYFGADNKIVSFDGSSWNTTALTLPANFYITSVAEYGDNLAISVAPLSGFGNSRVYLWNRNSSLATVSANIDWGAGILQFVEELNGDLMGVSYSSSTIASPRGKIIFKSYSGSGASQFASLTAKSSTTFLRTMRQKANNRVYFTMQITLGNTVQREGVFSVGIGSSGKWAIAHERTPNNDTSLVTGQPVAFFLIGDTLFQAYIDSSGVYQVSKTNDQPSYTASAIYESLIYNAKDSSQIKKLIGVTVMFEPLPAAGQVILKYKKDEDTTWTPIFTYNTDNGISHSAVNIESTGATLPEHKEIQFRIELTGGAIVTGFSFEQELTGKRIY